MAVAQVAKQKVPAWVDGAIAKKAAETANKGSVEANMIALGGCASPDDQKAMLLAMLGDMSRKRIRALGSRLIVATYVTPQVSRGGILFIDKRKDASRFEGKVGLVVAIGRTAFRYDGAFPWEDDKPEVGEWVWYRASDAPERWIKDVSCRTIEDDRVEGIITDPSEIY